MSINYFPPNNTLAKWPTTARDFRMTLYKGWYMAVRKIGNKFSGRVWRSLEKKKSGFKTEEDAVHWCERTVEFIIVSDSLLTQEKGSGI